MTVGKKNMTSMSNTYLLDVITGSTFPVLCLHSTWRIGGVFAQGHQESNAICAQVGYFFILLVHYKVQTLMYSRPANVWLGQMMKALQYFLEMALYLLNHV